MAGREIVLGGTYRHFKGGVYHVLGLATHTETGETLVLYSRSTTPRIWARPEAEFMSKVDREKYPDATQEYRFLLMPGPEKDGE